nr:MAG TPA: hypothetical protein [Caudoviricetes sp.]
MNKVICGFSAYSQHSLHFFNSYHIGIIVKQLNHSISFKFYQSISNHEHNRRPTRYNFIISIWLYYCRLHTLALFKFFHEVFCGYLSKRITHLAHSFASHHFADVGNLVNIRFYKRPAETADPSSTGRLSVRRVFSCPPQPRGFVNLATRLPLIVRRILARYNINNNNNRHYCSW